ncbi:malate dehydrogenase [Candidatus Woesearchaeota archaeon]|nr:malate dehydrogenase [Candidatus Woesearchaeota archaeon]
MDPLTYHEQGKAGKISIVPTKPCKTAEDLSLAYTPGVAVPCLEIQKNPDDAYRYTTKGNLIGVVTNGTAILGLGDIGPLAGKPVMEGKAVLFKRFANIDAFDIEIQEKDPLKLIEIIAALEPTFGGINLEDIKGPECFAVEEALIQRMNIPVFHDDQHGTAIIVSAALLNAVELVGKKMEKVRVVFSGAGAAAIACAKLLLELGVKKENIVMCDSQGVITSERTTNKYKAEFAQKTSLRTLAEAMVDADVFIGVSQGNIVSAEMIRTMAKNPIVFAMANPTPEISYGQGKAARADVIMATGRSDFPNQVNNVLGFPFIFRAALDVRAMKITTVMKLAAARALAALAKEKVPAEVVAAYGREFSFGVEYIIPKPFDPRVLWHVAPAVAEAAMKEGVARKKIDRVKYKEELKMLASRLIQGKFS